MANTQSTAARKSAIKPGKYEDQFESISDSTMIENIGDTLSAKYEDFKDSVEDAAESSVSFVKKYPLYTLAGALVLGVAAAMFISRREE